MARIVVSEFVSLDGVMEDPGGAEGFRHGGWALRTDSGAEGNRFKLDEVLDSEALLLGRRTYEGFAAAWPERDDEAGFARKMNTMPKYVVSQKLKEPLWENTHVLGGDPVEEVTALKERLGGTLLVPGSAALVNLLLRHLLVDELRLMTFPVILGDGRRLLEPRDTPAALRLAGSRVVGDGVVILTYDAGV